MSNPVRESMTRCTTPVGLFTIRIWRNEPLEETVSTAKLKECASVASVAFLGHTYLMAKAIAAIDSEISAVEVLGPDGCGTVYYPDWK